MKHSVYLQAKQQLKDLKTSLKCSNDKPMVRQSLNDYCDSLKREICRNYSISDKLHQLYSVWLDNYVCSLHP